MLSILALCFLLVSTCKKDDNPIPGETTLHYDGENLTGPQLATGYHELAVYFPKSTMWDHANWKLTEVTWYMGGFADSLVVKIYDQGATGAPGAVLYEADVTGTTILNQWQEHLLPTPLTLSGDGIWVSIGARHDIDKQSIGCDAGPNKSNGDWHYQQADTEWKTYVQRTITESVNWNIRAIVEE